MFEIIMLFAFLWAATSQLLPSDPSSRKRISQLKKRPGRQGFARGKKLFKKQRGAPGNGRAIQGRNSASACAA
jgi:hypothetical protein